MSLILKRQILLLANPYCLKILGTITLKNSAMKTLKSINGVKTLSKAEQLLVSGGIGCNEQYLCPIYRCCIKGVCRKCEDF